MADIDLPLFSFPPNWSEPVTERLSWLTDVLISRNGAEQRRSIRLSPRREFEYKINPIAQVRSYFDQWMHRISDEKCLLPLWHDKNNLTDAAEINDTRLEFDTRWTEFEEGGLAVLWADVFTYELVQISNIDDEGLDLTVGLDLDWPKGSVVYPIRRAWLDPDLKLTALTSRVGESTLGFTIDGANDYDPGEEVLEEYGTYPVITLEPNRRDDLETQYERTLETFDGNIGLLRRFDEIGRSFQTQFYNWTAHGRREHHELRQTLYRLNGRQKAFWLPSFNEDVTLSRPLAIGSNRLDIQKIGYRALGGQIGGRDRILIKDDDGDYQILQINGTTVGITGREERLNLTADSTFEAAAGRTGSFMDTLRLDNDVIEIVHHTDTRGVCEVGVACKSFADSREPTAPFISPRPEAEMSESGCGDAPTPFLYFRFEFLSGEGRIGEPGLGFWCYAQYVNHGLHGPNDAFVCKQYAQWKEEVHNAENTTHGVADNVHIDQWVEVRIQGGTGTAGCPAEGSRCENIRLLVRKPGWNVWRALKAWDHSNFWFDPDPVTGVGGFCSSGFPGTMYFFLPAADSGDDYADYTVAFDPASYP